MDALSAQRLVLAPHLPGYGGSPGPFSVSGACDELLDLLDQRGLDAVAIGGLSLGAIVALEFALQEPHRIRRLILCAGYVRVPAELRAQQEELASSLLDAPEDAKADVIEGLVSGVPEQYRSAAMYDLAGLAPADFGRIIVEINGYDATAAISAASVEALVCCGELDEPNLPLSQELADRLRTELQVIPGAGHVANLDAPDAFTELLRTGPHPDQ